MIWRLQQRENLLGLFVFSPFTDYFIKFILETISSVKCTAIPLLHPFGPRATFQKSGPSLPIIKCEWTCKLSQVLTQLNLFFVAPVCFPAAVWHRQTEGQRRPKADGWGDGSRTYAGSITGHHMHIFCPHLCLNFITKLKEKEEKKCVWVSVLRPSGVCNAACDMWKSGPSRWGLQLFGSPVLSCTRLPITPAASVLARPVPVIPRGALLPNVTTFTRPPPLCLPHLYNYMVLHLYKLTGCSGRNTHKSAVRPLSCIDSGRKTAFSPRWTASRMCQLREAPSYPQIRPPGRCVGWTANSRLMVVAAAVAANFSSTNQFGRVGSALLSLTSLWEKSLAVKKKYAECSEYLIELNLTVCTYVLLF